VIGLAAQLRKHRGSALNSSVACWASRADKDKTNAAIHTRFEIPNVAFLDCAAAQRAMLVIAWHAMIDEHESRCLRNSASDKT
jgi:hypothetical protein